MIHQIIILEVEYDPNTRKQKVVYPSQLLIPVNLILSTT